jgi:hypothetical protein
MSAPSLQLSSLVVPELTAGKLGIDPVPDRSECPDCHQDLAVLYKGIERVPVFQFHSTTSNALGHNGGPVCASSGARFPQRHLVPVLVPPPCPTCEGSGWGEPYATWPMGKPRRLCPDCSDGFYTGPISLTVECDNCEGSGTRKLMLGHANCWKCSGSGRRSVGSARIEKTLRLGRNMGAPVADHEVVLWREYPEAADQLWLFQSAQATDVSHLLPAVDWVSFPYALILTNLEMTSR